MFFHGQNIAFIPEHFQSFGNAKPCTSRLNDIVNITATGGDIRIGEGVDTGRPGDHAIRAAVNREDRDPDRPLLPFDHGRLDLVEVVALTQITRRRGRVARATDDRRPQRDHPLDAVAHVLDDGAGRGGAALDRSAGG